MATKHDRKLTELLEKLSRKWRAKFNGFEDGAAKPLRVLFKEYETEKRTLILAFLGELELDQGGVILDNPNNHQAATKVLKELKELQIGKFGKDSSFGKWVDRNYDKAAKYGVLKAKDSYKLGEGQILPRGYTPPTARLVNKTKRMTFLALTQRNGADIDLLRQSFLRHIFDPTATVQSLRRDLTNRGLIEGLIDTAGRRITADERADRIATYELGDLFRKSNMETVNDIYNDGKPNPRNTFYMWTATLDGRQGSDSERRNGQVLSEYQWSKKDFGDRYRGLPPLRPRDRCDGVHVRPEWFSPEVRKKVFNAQTEMPLSAATE